MNKLCKSCNTPRVDDKSIIQGTDIFCSVECFYRSNNIQIDSEVIDELEASIRNYESSISNYEEINNNLTDEITDLQETIKDLNDEKDDLEFEAQTLADTISYLQSKLDEA